ncbi:palmitoyltransferase ZDHHC1-like isoform X2 [Gigantopelta aegis]|uniref:palmitoyltransferase ZDHHC1-like isoform X2 n=1 Tax=Gigantopelta aegis TaxID=1735272 RepID=UPI001B88AC5F|nr:palmitoyltransferase ZDHHC1-like isoform X2 [Gigantopelta aegis]
MAESQPDEACTYRESCRRNGWTLPLHGFQIIAWVVVIFFLLIYFTMIVPTLPLEWQPAGYIINGLVSAVLLVCLVVATTINPADEAVLKKRFQQTLAFFDRSKHRHVIEDEHCFLCEVNVGVKSKHCSVCNKCVSDFDHHCKWLNNCVGGRNYRWFIMTLVSSCVAVLIILCMSLAQFIGYFTDRNSGNILKPFRDNINRKTAGNESSVAVFSFIYIPVPDWVWLTVLAITMFLVIICLGLLVHLLAFHFYLTYKKMSTYDYVLQQREVPEKDPKCKDVKKTWSSKFRLNRVDPSKAKGLSDAENSSVHPNNPEKKNGDISKSKEAVKGETPPPTASPILLKKMNPVALSDAENGSLQYKITKTKSSDMKTLEEVSKGETPISFAGPILHNINMNANPFYSTSSGRRKRKTKSHHKSNIDNGIVHGTNVEKNASTASSHHSDYHSDSAESLVEVNPSKPTDVCSTDSAVVMGNQYSSQASAMSSVGKHVKKKKKSRGKSHDVDNALNETTIFTVNDEAKLNLDGSLDYTDGFRTLPLTPVLLRKQASEVPPLDFGGLRSSTESSSTYRPYTGTVRSTDTVLYSGEQPLQSLKSVPEFQLDTEV